MRKFLFTIIIQALIVSCQSNEKINATDYAGFSEKVIALVGIDTNYDQKDTIGVLRIMIPNRLDTFYQWQDRSDCANCGYSKYRFSDKHYPQYAESGFFYTIQPDSTYQFNIWHKPFRETPDSTNLKPITNELMERYSYHNAELTSFDTGSVNYKIKEFRIVNDRSFLITAFSSKNSYLTWKPAFLVVATTFLKSRELKFVAECSAKDTAGFIKNMYKSMLSIQIQEK
ncbi:MAG TPA: hypothetical protein VFI06_01790 [Chitinophagaceae bacterium]|nr:hypothetical protein [Chitinophagaceae bacterium]